MNEPPRLVAATRSDDQPHRQLQAVLLDYEMLRDDERTFVATQSQTLTLAVTLFGVVIAGLSQTSQFGGSVPVPDIALGLLPLAPISLLVFLGANSAASVTRYYYMRALERWLRAHAGVHLQRGSAQPSFVAPRFIELVAAQGSSKRGRPIFRLFFVLYVLVASTLLLALVGVIATEVDAPTRILMAAIYTPLVTVLYAEAINGLLRGRDQFDRTVLASELLDRPTVPEAMSRRSKQRSLLSCVLLPRPNDLAKLVWAPGGLLLAWLVLWDAPAVGNALAQVGLLLFCLEYCAYNARYQLNDIRGFKADAEHVRRAERRRLPHGTPEQDRQTIRVVLASAVIRLGAGAVVADAFELATWGQIGVVTGLLLLSTLAYEVARAADGSEARRERWLARAIWITVSSGYALRFGAGLSLGGLAVDSVLTVALIIEVAALASATVLVTWALEAMTAVIEGTIFTSTGKRLQPHLQPHLQRLLPWFAPRTSTRPGQEAWLAGRTPVRAPWNVAFLVSVAAASIAGVTVVSYPNAAVGWWAPALALTGGLAILRAHRVASRLAAVAATLAVILAVSRDAEGLALAGVLALPYVVFSVFLDMSYDDTQTAITGLAGDVAKTAASTWRRTVKFVLGGATAAHLVRDESR